MHISSKTDGPSPAWVAAIACAFFLHVVYLNCVAEDAFIALRYAANLAHGHGLVWNPGAPPGRGVRPDFLWVLLSAAAIALGLPAVAFAQFMSVAAGAAVLVLTYRIGRAVIGWPPAVALVPAGLLAVSGPFATWSSSAMESTLFTLLILLSAAGMASDGERTGRVPTLARDRTWRSCSPRSPGPRD